MRSRIAEICRAEAIHWSFEVDGLIEPPAIMLQSQTATDSAAVAQEPRIVDLLLLDPSFFAAPRLARDLLRLAARHAVIGIRHREAAMPNSVLLLTAGESGPLDVAASIAERLDVPLQVAVYGEMAAERLEHADAVRRHLAANNPDREASILAIEGPAKAAEMAGRHRSALILLDRLDALALT